VNRLREIQLKMPEIRMPVFLLDLFYDLRERRLLPLVALILVALVAAPFLLSDSGSDSGEGSEQAPPAGASASRASSAQLTVVKTDHGLREPRKRLGHLSPKDPFHQQYTGPAQGTAQVAQTSTPTTETSTPTTVTSDTTSNGGGASPVTTSPSGPSSDGGGDSPVTVFTFAIDLKIVKTVPGEGGGKTKGEPQTKTRVLPPATLPGEKTQVLTYMGISPMEKKPLFLVSEDVTAVFGEADCVSGQGSCQVLEAEPGFPLTLVYGPNDVRYKFTVLKVEPVAAGNF
jgi:hypothetical protein